MILKQQSSFVLILALVLMVGGECQKESCMPPVSTKLLSSSYDSIPNFNSGAATLINKDSSRYNYFDITLRTNFSQSYEMAISIENIDSFQPNNQLDFFVNAIKKPTQLNVVFVIDSSIRWGSAQIYYIVSSRSDFSVGIFLANNAAFLETSKKTKITYSLPNKMNASTGGYLYSMPFISGLRTYDLTTNFTFSSTSYDSSKNILSIDLLISYTKSPLQSLYVSYLIFNMASPDLEITSFINLSFAPSNVNVFMGVSGITPFAPPTNKSKTPVTGLASSVQKQEAFDMIFGINGIIIQTQQSMDLLFRSPASTNATNFKVVECVSKKKCNQLFGTIVYDQSNIFTIKSKCIICMKHAFYNQTLGNCQCLKGFIERNNSCIKINESCEENATYDNLTATCKCKVLYTNVSNKCISIYQICPQGTIYFQSKCIKIVFSNAAVANCSPDSLFINKTCVPKSNCSQPLLLNLSNNQCQCPSNMQQVNNTCRFCTVNQTFINKVCHCRINYFRISGSCLECSPFAFFNGTNCVCFRYYQGDGFKCTKKALQGSELAKSMSPLGAKGAIILN